MIQKLITFFRVGGLVPRRCDLGNSLLVEVSRRRYQYLLGVGNKIPRRESRTNLISQTFSQDGVTEQLSPKLNQKLFDFLKKPVITDKTTKLIEQKIYTFDVDSQLTKKQIKEIFENFYGFPIQSIKTHRIAKKKKRLYNKLKPVKRVLLCFENKQEIPILKN